MRSSICCTFMVEADTTSARRERRRVLFSTEETKECSKIERKVHEAFISTHYTVRKLRSFQTKNQNKIPKILEN